MIEPNPIEVDRYRRALMALYYIDGNNVYKFIGHMAESLAYQAAARDDYLELLKEQTSSAHYVEVIKDKLRFGSTIPIYMLALIGEVLIAPNLAQHHIEDAQSIIDQDELFSSLSAPQQRWLKMLAGSNTASAEASEAARDILIKEISELVR